MNSLETAICSAPARDLAGLLAKLRSAMREIPDRFFDDPLPTLESAYSWEGWNSFERIVVSAWADAERLFGTNG